MISVKDALYNQMMDIYNSKGIDVTIQKCWKLMVLSENNARFEKYRAVKGELAEIVLECMLLEMSKNKVMDYPHVILKSLCIPFLNGSSTEMDITLITPYKIYMFECKSYKNKPTITKECLINGTTNVYEQNRLHTLAIHQRLTSAIKKSDTNSKPYRMCMFEMSTEGVDDKRDQVWKDKTPILNPDTFIPFMLPELEKNEKLGAIVDIPRCIEILKSLDANSKEMFDKHLARLKKKYG